MVDGVALLSQMVWSFRAMDFWDDERQSNLLDGAALASDVLKASHHGSKHSTSEAWLAAVEPSLFIVSAGKGNSYGHPAPAVLDRIEAFAVLMVQDQNVSDNRPRIVRAGMNCGRVVVFVIESRSWYRKSSSNRLRTSRLTLPRRSAAR